MKNRPHFGFFIVAFGFLAMLASVQAYAQMGPAMGGPGSGSGGRFAWDQTFTPGWALMSPEERRAWREQMHAVKTYEECVATREAHRRVMEERAREKGLQLRAPRRDGCEIMRSRGLIQ
ncbi:MAG: hypothetical protein N2441_08015 [Rhodocyclaceae bacterium]|nr:hypothetical protein [Rhodocyclaceae bacterium]